MQDGCTFSALVNVFEETRHEIVRKKIIQFFTSSMIHPFDLLKKQIVMPRIKCSTSGDLDIVITSSSESIENLHGIGEDSDFDFLYDDSVSDDSNMSLLLSMIENIKSIYQFASDSEIRQLDAAFPNLMVSLAPNAHIMATKGIPNFKYYEAAAGCIKYLINLHRSSKSSLDNAIHLAKLIITASMTIAGNVSEVTRMTQSRPTKYSKYVAVLLPFLSCAVPLIPVIDSILCQQLWITLVMQCGNVIDIFKPYKNDLAIIAQHIIPLVNTGGKICFQTSINSVQNLIKLFPPRTLQSSEDIGQLFCMLSPNAPRNFFSFQQKEAFLLLSIGTLEFARALSGNLAEYFDYYESDVNPSFTLCLDSLLIPLFDLYLRCISLQRDFDKKRASIQKLANKLFYCCTGQNPHVIQFGEKLLPVLLDRYSKELCHYNTVSIILDSLLYIQLNNHSRLPFFLDIGRKLFDKWFNTFDNAILAILFNYSIRRTKEYIEVNKIPKVYYVLDLIPEAYKDLYLSMNSLNMYFIGSIKRMTLEQILSMENSGEKTLLLSNYIQFNNRKDYLPTLLETSESRPLILSCMNIITCSPNMASELVIMIVYKMIYSANQRKGMFSDEVDEKMIEYQSALLIVLNEIASLHMFRAYLEMLIIPISKAQFLVSSCVFKSLLLLGNLFSSIITKHPFFISTHQIAANVLTNIYMNIVALQNEQSLYKYFNSENLMFFRKLNQSIPEIIKKIEFQQDHNLSAKYQKHEKLKLNMKRILATHNFDVLITQNLIRSLAWLLANQYSLMCSYVEPDVIHLEVSGFLNSNVLKFKNTFISDLLPIFFNQCPAIIPSLVPTLFSPEVLFPQLEPYFVHYPYHIAKVPILAYLVAKIKVEDLAIFKILPPSQAISLLTTDVLSNFLVGNYVIRCLEEFDSDEALMYIPQMVQALRYDSEYNKTGILGKFLQRYSISHDIFRHYLLWNLLYEKCNFSSPTDLFPLKLVRIEGNILRKLNEEQYSHQHHEFDFIDDISKISKTLFDLPIEERADKLPKLLQDVRINDDIYIPTNPNLHIKSIEQKTSKLLKSHSRVPLLINFLVNDTRKSDKSILQSSCIFKIEDDVRMDAMMIQLIDKFQKIYQESGIDCYLNPYRVFATGEKRGVIECITNAKSRHDMGVETGEDLLTYFVHKYGQVGTESFKTAQSNFIKSVAPYSVICYLFQVKDRHNANIMIDEEGHVMHIDFGFIFDISPGGNLKFEKSPFKFTNEMCQLIGSIDSPTYKLFKSLFFKCFLAARARYNEIEPIAYLMRNAGFPCFKPDSFKRLRQRFFIDNQSNELPALIEGLITESKEAVTTYYYDLFQYQQNKIYFI